MMRREGQGRARRGGTCLGARADGEGDPQRTRELGGGELCSEAEEAERRRDHVERPAHRLRRDKTEAAYERLRPRRG